MRAPFISSRLGMTMFRVCHCSHLMKSKFTTAEAVITHSSRQPIRGGIAHRTQDGEGRFYLGLFAPARTHVQTVPTRLT